MCRTPESKNTPRHKGLTHFLALSRYFTRNAGRYCREYGTRLFFIAFPASSCKLGKLEDCDLTNRLTKGFSRTLIAWRFFSFTIAIGSTVKLLLCKLSDSRWYSLASSLGNAVIWLSHKFRIFSFVNLPSPTGNSSNLFPPRYKYSKLENNNKKY